MDYKSVRSALARRAWALGASQHWAISRAQLLELGFHPQAITYRLQRGRLHRTRWPGVYAVGRPHLPRTGILMAAILAAGEGASLSDRGATELWALLPILPGDIDITVPPHRHPRRPGIRMHRRPLDAADVVVEDRIPVTTPTRTLIDIAPTASRDELESALREADKRDLIHPEELRVALDRRRGQRGVGVLRALLDRHTCLLTDSALERLFLPIARRAGLPKPLTQQWVNGFRVDFYWPDLGLVVETDGLRYHRTAQQQTIDRRRDQVHVAAGLTALRFTHAQVRYEPHEVETTLRRVAQRLAP